MVGVAGRAIVVGIGCHRPIEGAMDRMTEVRSMTAGLRNQPVAGAKVAIAPAVIAALIALALLVGGLLGVVAKSELDLVTANPAIAPAAASIHDSTSLIARRAAIAVDRGPLVSDPGPQGLRPLVATRAADHIGVTERLFPVSTPHHIPHGQLP